MGRWFAVASSLLLFLPALPPPPQHHFYWWRPLCLLSHSARDWWEVPPTLCISTPLFISFHLFQEKRHNSWCHFDFWHNHSKRNMFCFYKLLSHMHWAPENLQTFSWGVCVWERKCPVSLASLLVNNRNRRKNERRKQISQEKVAPPLTWMLWRFLCWWERNSGCVVQCERQTQEKARTQFCWHLPEFNQSIKFYL